MRWLMAFALALGGLLCLVWSVWVALGLWATALFAAFEAGRGWCALRACGIRTKL